MMYEYILITVPDLCIIHATSNICVIDIYVDAFIKDS